MGDEAVGMSTRWREVAQRKSRLIGLWQEACGLAEGLNFQLDGIAVAERVFEDQLKRPQCLGVVGIEAECLRGFGASLVGLPRAEVDVEFSGNARLWCADRAVESLAGRGVEGVERLPSAALEQVELWVRLVDEISSEGEVRFGGVDHWVVLLDCENPWSGSLWNELESLFAEAASTSVTFVLCGCDGWNADELDTLERHVAEIAIQRLGWKIGLWRLGSGYLADQPRLITELEQCMARCDSLGEALAAGRAMIEKLLSGLDVELERRRKVFKRNGGFFAELEEEIVELREAELAKINQRADRYVVAFKAGGQAVSRQFGYQLGVVGRWQACLLGDRLLSRVDEALQSELCRRLQEQGESDYGDILRSLRNHWGKVVPRCQSLLGLNLANLPHEQLDKFERSFTEALAQKLRRFLLLKRIKEVLEESLAEQRQLIGSWFTLGATMWLLAGVAGWLFDHQAGLILLGCGVLCAGVSWLRARRARREFRETLLDELALLVSDFREEFRVVIGAQVIATMSRYRDCYREVNQHIAESRDRLVPAQRQWRSIFLRFRALEQELE